jgi:hypothetical protein
MPDKISTWIFAIQSVSTAKAREGIYAKCPLLLSDLHKTAIYREMLVKFAGSLSNFVKIRFAILELLHKEKQTDRRT